MGSEEANELQICLTGPDGEPVPLEKGVYTNINVEALPEELQEPTKEFISELSKGCEFTMDLDDEGVEELKKFMEELSDPIPTVVADAFFALQDVLAKYGYAIFAIFRKVKETEDEKHN